MAVFIEANIHGNEEEGADAMMQAIRDLVTLPRGTNPEVDRILDHSILVVIPNMNPDGRTNGTRANDNGFDMNRDLIVQSQSEVRQNVAVQQQWLATNGLALHGYVNPTLIDGLTKPHNPGLEYDIFLGWNQRRLDANQADMEAIPDPPGTNGYRITRPVNDWCPEADEPNVFGGICDDGFTFPGPISAEGWDDWGPFYTQTYISLLGLDGSTVEMCSSTSPTGFCGGEGRLGSKKAQYVTFYSTMRYWLSNRNAMMDDQLEIYRRGVQDHDRPNCCDDPEMRARGFREAEHNWMIPYPAAYIIPFDGAGQRSDIEANRLVQWLLDNGIDVERATSSFLWDGRTFPGGTYIVPMDQALRGIALTALHPGQDVSDRITQLYAPPGAWSHGSLWGADVVEVERGAPFAPAATPISAPNALIGGVRGGTGVPADWYSVTLRGVGEVRAVLQLLRSGVPASVAESAFTSTTGGASPAGTLIFDANPATVAQIDAAGAAAGIWFERNVGVTRPPETRIARSPRIAVLVNSATPGRSDQSESLRAIFGPDTGFVSTVNGTGSLQNAATDPLLNFDVIYNTGQAYPATTSPVARARLDAFFARGGGYLGTSVSGTNFTFLTGAGLVGGTFTQGTQGAFGGIALWDRVGGTSSPLTGPYPGRDTLYLPSNITYFSELPTGAVVDGRYLDSTASMWVAGLWRDRDAAAAGQPVIVHGNTTPGSRYMGLATNPFSRQDAEREWTLMGQSAMWSMLTDEINSTVTFPAAGGEYNAAGWNAGCATTDGACGSAESNLGAPVASVRVAVQRVSTGLWWNGTAFASANPVYANATGSASWAYAFAASNFTDGQYVVRTRAVDANDVVENDTITPTSKQFLYDGTAPVSTGTLSGLEQNGWYRQATVTITASDNTGGSGLNRIEYRIDNGAFTTYTAPFNVTGDGAHVVEYRSVDDAGNVETLKSISLRIDATAPAITVTSPAAGARYQPGQNVAAAYSCSDAGSQIQSCQGPVANGAPIDTSRPGTHFFTVAASDQAGNAAQQSVSYAVELFSCRVSVSGRPVAGRRATLRIRVSPSGDASAIRIALRGAGVNRAVTANAADRATVRVRPSRAGTIRVAASAVDMGPCRTSVRVRRAPRPN